MFSQQPWQHSKAAHCIALLLGCAPLLLDQVIPPWGIPAAILAIWLILGLQGRSWADAGIIKPPLGWSRALLMGIGCAALMLALEQFVYPRLLALFGLPGQDISEWEIVEGNTSMLAIYLGVSCTTAGFGEELIFRGFLMTGLARLLGGGRAAWATGLILSSIIFGLLHIRTGVGGVISTGMHGAVLAALFLLSGRSIWAPYVAQRNGEYGRVPYHLFGTLQAPAVIIGKWVNDDGTSASCLCLVLQAPWLVR